MVINCFMHLSCIPAIYYVFRDYRGCHVGFYDSMKYAQI